jgi:ribonuclease HII
MIVGIDEVGRGPWAGPLVVGAVVLGDAVIDGLTDSKKLSKAKREALSAEITLRAAACGLGWVDAAELDDIGMSAALTVAARRALEQISVPYHEIIIDGTVNLLAGTGKGAYVTTLKKADLLISAVSAASIIAKVARDDYMSEQAEIYPGYGFERNVGYGTQLHQQGIKEHGLTQLHRRSFAPIATYASNNHARSTKLTAPTNTAIGNAAETSAAEWLVGQGFEIIERNWKTRFCEIDIVARKDSTLFFVEVKHRKTAGQGGGMAAVTDRKQRQMRFAATLYLTKHPGMNARLAALATTGLSTAITIEELLLLD